MQSSTMGATLERFCGPGAFGGGVTLTFEEALRTCIDRIPRGRVATCGAVARALGDIRAARAVAEWLRSHPDTAAGHRVVRADGRPVLPDSGRLLGEEGPTEPGGLAVRARFINELPEVPLLQELRGEQERLAAEIVERDEGTHIERFGGADVSYSGDRAFAVAATVDADTLDATEIVVREIRVDFPYIPTYLAFREFPAIRSAIDGLSVKPDLLFVDGHGRLHPALFGFACYAGARLDLPTIGIAKHPLAGRPAPSTRDSEDAVSISLGGSVRGFAWRPPGTSRPIYVSVGNRVSLESALALTRLATKEKYPEPLRIADRISKEERKKNEERSASEWAALVRPPAQGSPGV